MIHTASKIVEEFRAKAKGTNVNDISLLATDYLNHFNEVVMMLDMVPDMPEMIEDAKTWQPKSYIEHFADSTFKDKELAIEAYKVCPDEFRLPFDLTVKTTFRKLRDGVSALDLAVQRGACCDELREMVLKITQDVGKLLDVASGIIHGSTSLKEGAPTAEKAEEQPLPAAALEETQEGVATMDQSDIDALFD